MTSIDLYFDLLSPFAYVALARLDELPADVPLRMRPIILGPVLAHWGQRGPAEIAPKRTHTYRLSCFLAEKHGLPIRFPPRHPFNPLTAMRLLAGAETDTAMVRAAFGFVWGEGRAVDTPEEVTALAERLGLDPALAQSESAKARLRGFTEEAIARGIFGVPTFAVTAADGREELFWGVDSIDMLLAWLQEPRLFDREPYASLGSVEMAVTRKAVAG